MPDERNREAEPPKKPPASSRAPQAGEETALAPEAEGPAQQELRLLEKRKEKEAAQLAEQARWMREELQTLQARVKELETERSAAESLRLEQAQMQQELKRKNTTLLALQEESRRLLARATQVEGALREFYTRAVSPLTIACASADLLPARSLAPEDAETVADLKRNIRAVLQVLSALVTKMSEMGISVELPAALPGSPARRSGPAKPPDQSSSEPGKPRSEKAAGDRKPRQRGS